MTIQAFKNIILPKELIAIQISTINYRQTIRSSTYILIKRTHVL